MNRVMQNDGRFLRSIRQNLIPMDAWCQSRNDEVTCFAPGSMYRGDGEVEGLKSAVSCEILSGTMAEDHA